FRRKPDIGLHHRHFALVDDEHRYEFDADKERVQIVGTVEEGIVLQADAATIVEEGLEILIVIVKLVLDGKNGLHEVRIPRGWILLELRYIAKIPKPVGDGTLGKRNALQRGDDADHVHIAPLAVAAFGRARFDPNDVELRGRKPKCL